MWSLELHANTKQALKLCSDRVPAAGDASNWRCQICTAGSAKNQCSGWSAVTGAKHAAGIRKAEDFTLPSPPSQFCYITLYPFMICRSLPYYTVWHYMIPSMLFCFSSLHHVALVVLGFWHLLFMVCQLSNHVNTYSDVPYELYHMVHILFSVFGYAIFDSI